MSEERSSAHDEKAVREFLKRLSRDKHAVSAHLGIRVDREHADFITKRPEPQKKQDG